MGNQPQYYRGLSKSRKKTRRKQFKKRSKIHHKNPKAYNPFSTDYKYNKKIKTKTSQYTKRFKELVSKKKKISKSSIKGMSFKEKAKFTGIPESILKMVYNKGLAAWRTGHRPGATQAQWGHARVNSFIMKGKTYYTADAHLVKEAKKKSKKARDFWNKLK